MKEKEKKPGISDFPSLLWALLWLTSSLQPQEQPWYWLSRKKLWGPWHRISLAPMFYEAFNAVIMQEMWCRITPPGLGARCTGLSTKETAWLSNIRNFISCRDECDASNQSRLPFSIVASPPCGVVPDCLRAPASPPPALPGALGTLGHQASAWAHPRTWLDPHCKQIHKHVLCIFFKAGAKMYGEKVLDKWGKLFGAFVCLFPSGKMKPVILIPKYVPWKFKVSLKISQRC